MKKYILLLIISFFALQFKVNAFSFADMSEFEIASASDIDITLNCIEDVTQDSNNLIGAFSSNYTCDKSTGNKTLNQKYKWLLVKAFYTDYVVNSMTGLRSYINLSTYSNSIDLNDSKHNFQYNLYYKIYITANGVNYACYRTNEDYFICPNKEKITAIHSEMWGGLQLGGAKEYATLHRELRVQSGIYMFNTDSSEIAKEVKETNKTLKDDDMSGGNQSADSFKENEAFDDTSGIESIINLPLNFINSLSSSCQPLELTIPWLDYPLEIPCLGDLFVEKVPLLANVLKVIINGFIVYRILLGIVDLIHSAKNPDDDRIEVLDL